MEFIRFSIGARTLAKVRRFSACSHKEFLTFGLQSPLTTRWTVSWKRIWGSISSTCWAILPLMEFVWVLFVPCFKTCGPTACSCAEKYLSYIPWSDEYPLAPVKLQSSDAVKPMEWLLKTKDTRNITLEAVRILVYLCYFDVLFAGTKDTSLECSYL